MNDHLLEVLITTGPVYLGLLINFLQSRHNAKKLGEQKDQLNKQDAQLVQIHELSNGASQKLQDMAEARGEVTGHAAGVQDEKKDQAANTAA